MRVLEDERQSLAKRGNIEEEAKEIASYFETDYEMEALTMFRLMRAFQNVLVRKAREKDKVVHTIIEPPYTIEGEKLVLRELTFEGTDVPFEKLFENTETRLHAVFTFLAMLELIQEQVLTIVVGEGYNNFWIRKKRDEEKQL